MGAFMLEYGKDFRASNLEVIDCSGPPSAILVNARLASGGKVKFKISRSASGYVIRDMNVQSIWLAQQLRSAFVGTITRGEGDIDELFKYLRS